LGGRARQLAAAVKPAHARRLEALRVAFRGRTGVGLLERVGRAHAFDRPLGDAVRSGSKPGNEAAHEADSAPTIDPAGLTVTADGQSMTCGGVPALTRRHAGLAYGDASASPAGGLATRATGGNVGAYLITQGALAAGDCTSGTFHQGALTVDPAGLAVASDDQAVTYSSGVPALTNKHAGLVSGGASASFTGGLAAVANSSSTVGSYPITQGAPAGTGNYSIGTFDGGALALSAAPHLAGTATSHFGGNELAKFTTVGAERVPTPSWATSRPAPSSAPAAAAWAARAP
jgi:hypothetical protein